VLSSTSRAYVVLTFATLAWCTVAVHSHNCLPGLVSRLSACTWRRARRALSGVNVPHDLAFTSDGRQLLFLAVRHVPLPIVFVWARVGL